MMSCKKIAAADVYKRQSQDRAQDQSHQLRFPAYAGVIPDDRRGPAYAAAFPRICGGDPGPTAIHNNRDAFSPHMRG